MSADLENTNLLTTKQVAILLHIHPNTVRRWSNKGILKSYRISKRGDRRFRKEDVAILCESQLLDHGKRNTNYRNNIIIHI
jgi:excisionase family DNA binding protein